MRYALTLVALLALSAHAGERIRPTLDLSAFRVKIQWVQSALDLEKVRGQYEPRPASDSGTGERVKGFSILVQNKKVRVHTKQRAPFRSRGRIALGGVLPPSRQG